MRIFLDANILFSAACPTSTTRKMFTAAGRFGELITNAHAWEEAERNLLIKRPEHATHSKDLERFITISDAFTKLEGLALPLKDVPILCGAVGANCSHLWTSDKQHFGKWYGKKYHNVMIVSSVMLADLLMDQGWKPLIG
jgi:uncharacterized protein